MAWGRWRRAGRPPAAVPAAPGGDVAERGASLVEYALLIALIVLVTIVAMEAVGTNLVDRFREFAAMLRS